MTSNSPTKRLRSSPPNSSTKPETKLQKVQQQFDIMWSAGTGSRSDQMDHNNSKGLGIAFGTKKPKKTAKKTTIRSRYSSRGSRGRRQLTPMRKREELKALSDTSSEEDSKKNNPPHKIEQNERIYSNQVFKKQRGRPK